MGQLGQLLLALGFIVLVFMAGYGARAALSRLRRQRGSFGRRHGRLIYAGRRVSVPDSEEAQSPVLLTAAQDNERLASDLNRLGDYVDELRTLFTDQQAMCNAARSDLATAAERFRASVEQSRALTVSLNERLDAAQRLQVDFEQMVSRLRKRGKDGGDAVLPFKVRQRRLSERK
jgi:ABC-type transporter Mla subunit MlaD